MVRFLPRAEATVLTRPVDPCRLCSVLFKGSILLMSRSKGSICSVGTGLIRPVGVEDLGLDPIDAASSAAAAAAAAALLASTFSLSDITFLLLTIVMWGDTNWNLSNIHLQHTSKESIRIKVKKWKTMTIINGNAMWNND